MIDINIYRDGEIIKQFTDQDGDFNAFAWMLRNQSNSVSHALRYEGYKVEEIDKDTGKSEFWKPY